jgi:hypothetical protein
MKAVDSLPTRTIDPPAQAERPAATDNPAWKVAVEIFIGLALVAVVYVTWVKMLAPLFAEMLP